MIVRYGGGNDGIKDYLENGRKVDRHFSRDELDKRVPIEGDLNLTHAIINSIEDHSQERYLHISMSFNEPDITEDKMAEVFQQYKRTFMGAYGDDEYNIYAEIHWPKIKEAYNHQKEQMEPRYPHIHIVVPKKNLLTGGFLDPVGLHERNVKYFDAIQEKLNRDNDLSSPRNSPRIGTNHYEEALGKYKDKEFRTKNGVLKQDIYNAMIGRDVRTVTDFKSLLSEFGEVKTRNAGKDNEYFSIKLPDDKKFTNLKANIFDKAYIEDRRLTLEPVTDAQVERRVNTWKSITSREIKHISNASAKVKEIYRELSLPKRREFLAQREADYERRHRGSEEPASSPRRGRRSAKTELSSLRARNYEPSDSEFARAPTAGGARHLHELRAGNVDHFHGENNAADNVFLPSNEGDHLQYIQANGDSGLRHNLYVGAGRGRLELVDATDPGSSVLGSLIAQENEKQEQKNDLQRFAEIRKNLDPHHLLAFVQIRFGVDPDNHPVSKARDGSPRIKAGKQNLNVSDFLTKHIGLEWKETSEILLSLYEKQQAGIVDKPKSKVAHIDDWRRFRYEVYPKNVRTYDELKNQIKVSQALSMKSINAEYFARRKSITNDTSLTRSDKHYFRSVVILEKLQKVEFLQQRVKEQNSLSNRVKYPYSTLFYDFATKNEEISMKALDELKKRFHVKPAPDSENSIGGATGLRTPHNMPSGAEAAKRARLIANLRNQEREIKELKIRISDLRPTPLQGGAVAFNHKEHGKQIFVNHPDRVELNRVTEEDEVAVGMIYAIERFGSPLDIKGTPEFKAQVIAVAAERDMDIAFTDESLNESLKAKRLELGMEPLQANEIGAEELQLDTSLPREQAVDKALLDSKVAELEAVNLAHVDVPAASVEREARVAAVGDALQRHEEIQSGFVDDDRVAEIARADLDAWTYLDGRPEQQQLALAVSGSMENQAYSTYMAKNGPQELQLTIDATKVVQGREAEREAQQPTAEVVQTDQSAQQSPAFDEQEPAAQPQSAPAATIQFTFNGEPATIDLTRFQGEARTVERMQAELQELDRIEPLVRAELQAVEQERDDFAPDRTQEQADELEARFGSLSEQVQDFTTARASIQAELYQAAEPATPAKPAMPEEVSRMPQMPEFTHMGQPATIDLSRYQRPAQEAQVENTLLTPPERLERLDKAIEEARMTVAEREPSQLAPGVATKIAAFEAVNATYSIEDTDQASQLVRRGTVADVENRHAGLQADRMMPSDYTRAAKEDLEAFVSLEGKPEQQSVALAMGRMMENEDYRSAIEANGPADFGDTVASAQVVSDNQQTMAPENVRINENDMEI